MNACLLWCKHQGCVRSLPTRQGALCFINEGARITLDERDGVREPKKLTGALSALGDLPTL